MSFDALGLTPELLRAVADQGYTEPTPVQRESIPAILAGRDILAGAQTGTGKTAAFVLPMLQLLNGSRTPGWNANAPDDPRDRRPFAPPPVRALVLTPTRELCLQVEESVRVYGAHRRIRSVAIYGGVGYEPQNRALRAGPGIVVATPGRLLDHIGQGHIDLSRLEILVLDEADRMLDMGFIRDIRKVIELLPRDRQTLLFSATFSDDIRQLAGGILRDPAMVQVTPRNTATELVTQVVHPVDRERKRELLSHLIRTGRIEQALVFTRTKHGANRLAEQLGRDGIAAAAIHGNKSQGQRVRALDDFKAGRAAILVATEVASRGLDIEDLPHVVNFELPLVAEDYVHRIGRTGRAGATGDAISLVCVDEAPLLRDIERLLGRAIPSEAIPGFEPDRSIRPEAIQRGGGNRGQRPMGRPQPRPMSHPTPRPVGALGGSWAGRPSQHAPTASAGRPTHQAPRQPLSAGPAGGPGQHRPGRRPGNPSGGRPAVATVGFGNRPVANRPVVHRPAGDQRRPNRPGRGRPGPGAHLETGAFGPRRGGPQPGHRPAGPNDRPRIETLPGERLARTRQG